MSSHVFFSGDSRFGRVISKCYSPIVHGLPFLQSLLTLLAAGKFLTALKIIVYRITSWLGIGFFWKKGKDSGQKRFYWVSFLIWLTSWAIIIYFSPKVWHLTLDWFRSL